MKQATSASHRGFRSVRRRIWIEAQVGLTLAQDSLLKYAAQFASDAGEVWLAKAKWAKGARIHVRTLDRSIDALIGAGIMKCVHKARGGKCTDTSRYIVFGFIESLASSTPGVQLPLPPVKRPSGPRCYAPQTDNSEQINTTGVCVDSFLSGHGVPISIMDRLNSFPVLKAQLIASIHKGGVKNVPAYIDAAIRKHEEARGQSTDDLTVSPVELPDISPEAAASLAQFLKEHQK